MSRTKEELDDIIKKSVQKAFDYYQNNNLKDSEEILNQILKVRPTATEAICILGLVKSKMREYDLAIKLFKKCKKMGHNQAECDNNIGLVYAMKSDMPRALMNFRKAMLGNMDNDCYKVNYGSTLLNAGQYKKCIEWFKAIIPSLKNKTDAILNLGFAYSCAGDTESAFLCTQEAVRLNPEFDRANFNLGCFYASRGDLIRGFEKMEAIFDKKKFDLYYKKPYWNGEDIDGKRILIFTEQATGDMINFVRFVKILKDKGAYTILHVGQESSTIFQSCKWIDEVRCIGSNLEYDYDYYVSVSSIPRIMKLTLDMVNCDIPYLRPVHDKITNHIDDGDIWDKYINKFKVGIVWAGSAYHSNDRYRSCYLNEFRSISEIPGIQLFSLQKDKRVRHQPQVGDVDLLQGSDGMNIVDLGDYLTDFNHTSAALQHMDLLLTVDTSTAHLAGAMGIPTWIILPANADWRWFLNRSDSPWYPTVKLFRQKKLGIWDGVFKKVHSELSNIIKH